LAGTLHSNFIMAEASPTSAGVLLQRVLHDGIRLFFIKSLADIIISLETPLNGTVDAQKALEVGHATTNGADQEAADGTDQGGEGTTPDISGIVCRVCRGEYNNTDAVASYLSANRQPPP
jgi:hypothetical protein